jgi:hypothetical protein
MQAAQIIDPPAIHTASPIHKYSLLFKSPFSARNAPLLALPF